MAPQLPEKIGNEMGYPERGRMRPKESLVVIFNVTIEFQFFLFDNAAQERVMERTRWNAGLRIIRVAGVFERSKFLFDHI